MGLFSAGRGEEGGRMGVRDEEEREEGKPGEGVSGVAGLEGGNEDGLEFVSSVELSDSLRKWVYLVFGTSSIMNLQCQFLYPQSVSFYIRKVHTGSSDSIKVSLSQHSKFLWKRTHGHLSVSLSVRAASICLRVCPPLITRRPTPSCFKNGFARGESGTGEGAEERRGVPVSGRTWLKKVCFQCASADHVVASSRLNLRSTFVVFPGTMDGDHEDEDEDGTAFALHKVFIMARLP